MVVKYSHLSLKIGLSGDKNVPTMPRKGNGAAANTIYRNPNLENSKDIANIKIAPRLLLAA